MSSSIRRQKALLLLLAVASHAAMHVLHGEHCVFGCQALNRDLELQDQKEMQGILLDAISEQIRGMQSITKLLTQKLEKVLHFVFKSTACLRATLAYLQSSKPTTDVLSKGHTCMSAMISSFLPPSLRHEVLCDGVTCHCRQMTESSTSKKCWQHYSSCKC